MHSHLQLFLFNKSLQVSKIQQGRKSTGELVKARYFGGRGIDNSYEMIINGNLGISVHVRAQSLAAVLV